MISNVKHRLVLRLAILISVMLTHSASTVAADKDRPASLIPPENPRQSITYWKKFTLDEDDPAVIQSRQVFSVLLRAWDQSRIEPALYVVESDAGAWAASLADGNILLSKQAYETSFSYGKQRGEHLLAFVLAHELAHQRADDLWHQRFFRMIGTQSVESQQKMMAGIKPDADMLSQLEEKEAQADHDGLVLMSSVGFDPYQVVSDKDFFTLWVENIWQQSCKEKQSESSQLDACRQAITRAMRTRAQLQTVANQSMLYDLGVQSFVANDYQQAREYFVSYGRDYPGRAIISAIGLTYFAQAQAIQKRLNTLRISNGQTPAYDFYYPLILDARIDTGLPVSEPKNKRANIESIIQKLEAEKTSLLEQSVAQFEKAIRLAPDYRKTYLLLASAHLLAENTYRVRGVLQGRYLQRFGQDEALNMLLALTETLEGNSRQSISMLKKLIESAAGKTASRSAIPENILTYSLYYNLAEIYQHSGDSELNRKLWMQLAQRSKQRGDTLLFRLALQHIRPDDKSIIKTTLKQAPSVNGYTLGKRFPGKADGDNASHFDSIALWDRGERFTIYLSEDARYITEEDGTLISAWQTGATSETEQHAITPDLDLKTGDPADRPFKSLGMPDRHLDMTSGEYLAYDRYGLAVRISNDQVKGWFLYDNH